MTTPSRRFPALGWAWPAGALDLLLTAAICPDEARAREALDTWLARHDIDEVGFRDHRLLVAIAERFGKTLTGRAEYPRLLGLQRHLWTRSRMALAEAGPALRTLAGANVRVMLLKGAARLAAEPGAERARVAHDVDILVPPADFPKAMAILFDLGWQASSGESRLCLEARAASIRAMNFFRNRFGDIDLHQWACGEARVHAGAEARLWAEARAAIFLGRPALVPSPTDRLLLAIAGSGRDAHAHSDWLVDCARIAAAPSGLDWQRLLDTLEELGCVVPAQVALGYLHRHLGLPVPAEAAARLLAAPGPVGALRRIPDLLEARPRANWGPASQLGRGLAKQWRRARLAAAPAPGLRLSGRLRRAGPADGAAPPVLTQRLCDLADLAAAGGVFDLELLVEVPGEVPGLARRLEFELNSETAHLARLRARMLRPRAGPVRASFSGRLEAATPAGGAERPGGLWLQARPGRCLRGGESPAETARYAATPFSVLSFSLGPSRPGEASRPGGPGPRASSLPPAASNPNS